jgi:hypothetical protein
MWILLIEEEGEDFGGEFSEQPYDFTRPAEDNEDQGEIRWALIVITLLCLVIVAIVLGMR